jgi:DNA-binding response OmpR family regulator/cellulose synthase/poly-beta-1,6-N-acetylglucosamine synthase-like glycosyltransferase
MSQTTPPLILAVDDDPSIQKLVKWGLLREGYEVILASDGEEALALLEDNHPALIISDVSMPNMSGLEFIQRVREDSRWRTIPAIMLTAQTDTTDIVAGFSSGADDYLAKPFKMQELLARVRSKLERPSVPAEMIHHDRVTGLLGMRAMTNATERELQRFRQTDRPLGFAVLELVELPVLQEQMGRQTIDLLLRNVAHLCSEDAQPLDAIGTDGSGRILILFPESSERRVRARLQSLAERISATPIKVREYQFRMTPSAGYTMSSKNVTMQDLLDQAMVAMEQSALHLDLQPVMYTSKLSQQLQVRQEESQRSTVDRLRQSFAEMKPRLILPTQVAFIMLLSLILPLIGYFLLGAAGLDITQPLYIFLVISLAVTALLIWVEGFLALKRVDPPKFEGEYPPASAIIAAYMPNEAPTIRETIEAFQRQDYPGRLQIILAYNTPNDMPIEDELREIARQDPRFVPMRIHASTSKAQNVNAALAHVTGEFVGIFDADHQPDPGSFMRAWDWIADGADVVQGHAIVRNGDESWMARTVAVEFEMIYAVSHPGRARLHGFGIFGGSNGYWRTDLLSSIRFRGSMLTEDIDSAMRVNLNGGTIISDPFLKSRELAPVSLNAIWHQRMRWAQGWFQVSKRHLPNVLRQNKLSFRQRLGMIHLMGWREVYPWLTVQIFPIMIYWILQHGAERLDWIVPVFVFTTLFTQSTGPGQVYFAWRQSDDEVKQRKKWYLWYLFISTVFYTPLKNLIAVVAQLNDIMRQRQWKVTPRSTTTPAEQRESVSTSDD